MNAKENDAPCYSKEIWSQHMSKSSLQTDAPHKVILLGNSSVGKTSLAIRWLRNNFDEVVRPTIGATNSIKEIHTQGRTLRITLWDTAGQEQFRSITPLYVRGAKCGIIVVAQNDPDSFQSINTWLELLNSSEEQVPAILAINKTDLENPGTEDLIELYKTKFKSFFLVSAKTGDNVEQLFKSSALIADESNKAQPVTPSNSVSIDDKPKNGCC